MSWIESPATSSTSPTSPPSEASTFQPGSIINQETGSAIAVSLTGPADMWGKGDLPDAAAERRREQRRAVAGELDIEHRRVRQGIPEPGPVPPPVLQEEDAEVGRRVELAGRLVVRDHLDGS